MAKFISIASAKGGVGKTTCAINLANALRILGKNTVVVDVSQKSPHIHSYLGAITLNDNFSLRDALDLKIHPYHAIHRHSSGLNVLPNKAVPNDTINRHHNIVPVLTQLHEYFDYVVLDSSPGFARDMVEASKLGETYLVTTPDIVSVAEAIKSKNLIEEAGQRVHGVIVNKHDGEDYHMDPSDIESAIGSPVVGFIGYDAILQEAANLRQPVHFSHPSSDASRHFISLAKKFIDN